MTQFSHHVTTEQKLKATEKQQKTTEHNRVKTTWKNPKNPEWPYLTAAYVSSKSRSADSYWGDPNLPVSLILKL